MTVWVPMYSFHLPIGDENQEALYARASFCAVQRINLVIEKTLPSNVVVGPNVIQCPVPVFSCPVLYSHNTDDSAYTL